MKRNPLLNELLDYKIEQIKLKKFPQFNFENDDAEKNAQIVYRIMQNTYKEKWVNRYGTQNEGIWSAVLSNVSKNQVERGIEKFTKLYQVKNSKFKHSPPEPFEFLEMCRPAANDDFFKKRK